MKVNRTETETRDETVATKSQRNWNEMNGNGAAMSWNEDNRMKPDWNRNEIDWNWAEIEWNERSVAAVVLHMSEPT